MSDYNLEENTEAYEPITFEEIVIVMIKASTQVPQLTGGLNLLNKD